MKGKSNRNLGIDALRIVSMMCIVLMHILYKGGLLEKTSGGVNSVLWLLETACCCSVNCFAMISGYAMYSKQEKKCDFKKYIKLWAGVFFWSFGITLAFFVNGGADLKTLVKSALPVISNEYWYFSAYTVLFFAVPWINKLLRACSERETALLAATGFVLFCCVGLATDPFGIDYGYTFPWLMYMYIVGAFIKKCGVAQKVKCKTAAMISLLSVAVSLFVLMFSPFKADLLIKYISPTMVLHGVCMLVIFSKIKFGKTAGKIISFFAPATFGVYIIHEHPLIKSNFEKWFGWIANLNLPYLCAFLVILVVVVFAVCAFAEKLRIWLFEATRLFDIGRKKEEKL